MPNGLNKTILGFVGPIASGKGTACQYLKDKYGSETYRFSTMLRDILNRLYIENSRENLQKISSVLRAAFGDDLMAKTIANDVKDSKTKIVAVDGVRREPDIKYLRKISGFYLIAMDADQKIRFNRIIKRGENTDDTNKTFTRFQQDEEQEAERQIKKVAETADFNINNNGTLNELHQQIEDILRKVNEN
jgi:dephospho-CoA kinase